MRTIKFRGKDNHKGDWVFGSYAQCEDGDTLIVKYYSDSVKATYHVNPSTVGQFIGLRDKNGKEIYEGDIVQTKSYGYMAIEYQCGAWILRDKDCFWLSLEEYDDNAALTENLNSVEVVGNIHDTPELLKYN